MSKAPKQQARYTEAVRGALNGGPQPEATLAEAVLRAVGSKQCIEMRRHYARLAWVKAGHARKSWKPGDVTAEREALLGAMAFARRGLRGLGRQVKKRVMPDKSRVYSLVAGKAAPQKRKEG